MGEKGDFQPLLMTNRKLHMRFRLAPWMTLNCYKFEFLLGISRDFVDLRGNNGKTNEDRPVLTNRKLHVLSIGTKVDDFG